MSSMQCESVNKETGLCNGLEDVPYMIHGPNLGYETGRKIPCNSLEETDSIMLCV
jgi:hypothetical protein